MKRSTDQKQTFTCALQDSRSEKKIGKTEGKLFSGQLFNKTTLSVVMGPYLLSQSLDYLVGVHKVNC